MGTNVAGRIRFGGAAVLAALLASVLVGCSSEVEIDTSALEASIASDLEDQPGSGSANVSVECPESVKGEPGREFHCIATDDQGNSARITATIEDEDGYVTWAVD